MTSFTRQSNIKSVDFFSSSAQVEESARRQATVFAPVFLSYMCICICYKYVEICICYRYFRWAGVAAPKSWSQPVGGQPPTRQHRVAPIVKQSSFNIWNTWQHGVAPIVKQSCVTFHPLIWKHTLEKSQMDNVQPPTRHYRVALRPGGNTIQPKKLWNWVTLSEAKLF